MQIDGTRTIAPQSSSDRNLERAPLSLADFWTWVVGILPIPFEMEARSIVARSSSIGEWSVVQATPNAGEIRQGGNGVSGAREISDAVIGLVDVVISAVRNSVQEGAQQLPPKHFHVGDHMKLSRIFIVS